MADDRELWESIRRGEANAFDAFYRETAPRMLRFLRQLIGNRQAAEDVMHETFLQLWRRPNRYRPESGSMRAYLFGIARKRAAEWWRQRTPEASLTQEKPGSLLTDSDGDYTEPSTRPNATMWSALESRSLVGDAFSRLPTDQRALLWLREVEGQSYAELAAILEVPIGTVRSRLFAAREELRRIWHGEDRKNDDTETARLAKMQRKEGMAR